MSVLGVVDESTTGLTLLEKIIYNNIIIIIIIIIIIRYNKIECINLNKI